MEAVGIGFFRVMIVMVLVVAGTYVALKILGFTLRAIGAVFRGIGRLFWHVATFVAGMVSDALHLVGALVTALVFLPALVMHVAFGRWSAANHYGQAVEQELARAGGCVYRLAIGRVARLLGLSQLTDGVERRLPDVVARAPSTEPRRAGFAGGAGRAGARSDRFDGYRVVGSLQAGGSGARLWLAEPDAPTRRRLESGGRHVPSRVVIKSFSLADGSTLPQIVRENRALESARDLGLVLEHRLEGQRFHYVMPYVPGDDLGLVAARLHDADGPEGLSDANLRRVLGHEAELLETLDRFHRKGLWHKDVKPSNIIVSEGRVHLVDLGLMTPLTSAMTLTTHGTEYFRDPEMVRLALRGVKVHEVDGVKFDVYGAGATLYAMVENSFPAHGSLSQTTRRCPEALRWVIRKAMADMGGRYTSARQMLADVAAVRDAEHPFKLKPAQLPSFSGAADAAGPAAADAPPLPPPPRREPVYALGAPRPRTTNEAAPARRRRRPGPALLIALIVGLTAAFLVDDRHLRLDDLPGGPSASDPDVVMRADGTPRALRVLPAVTLDARHAPAAAPGTEETLLPPVGTVLLLDDLPASADPSLDARVERLCRDLRRARYAVVRDAGAAESRDEDIALLASARMAVGLSDPSDAEAVDRLKAFLAAEQPELDGVLWFGGGRDGAPVDCLAIGRDATVTKQLASLVADARS